jgi:molecular chaperone GrpE
LRSQADAQNARRRAEQDIEKAHKFGQDKIVNDLLPVVDNLERALSAIDMNNETFTAIAEGIQLTLKSFIDALARHQVLVVNPHGEPFDPNLHQAVSAVPNPDVEPNTVINVFQKGYTLNGRLLRPAMVVVSKAP